jgi:hypothetical protein
MSDGAGVHYFAPASLLAAVVIAGLANDLMAWRRYALVALSVLLLGECYRSMRSRRYDCTSFTDEGLIALGEEVQRHTHSGDLIVVRSPRVAFDTFWRQPANYHDPRLFYLSHTRGWSIGREQEDVGLVANAIRHGARLFVDPLPERSEVLDEWLAKHGTLILPSRSVVGRIWRLDAGSLALDLHRAPWRTAARGGS